MGQSIINKQFFALYKFTYLMFQTFCLFLLFGFISNQANAAFCIEFGGKDTCIHAKLEVTEVKFANAWGNFGPPQYFPSQEAAIAYLNHGTQSTGSYASGWSTDTPLPAENNITQAPVNVVWSTFDKYGNETVQSKGIEALNNGVLIGKWTLYKLNTNTYPCPTDTTLVDEGVNPQGRPYPMCRFVKPVVEQCTVASSPSTPKPCSITTGNKFKPQQDWTANVGPLQFKRNYNSLGSAYNTILGGTANASPFGGIWTHNYNLQLLFPTSTTDVKNVILMRPNGLNISAVNTYTDTTIAGAGGWFIARNKGLKLNKLADGTWQVINVETNDIESYDANGRLTKISYRNGQFVTLAYPATVAVVYYNPTQVTDNFGQSLIFAYNTIGYLTSVKLPTGKFIRYTYDTQNRLSTVDRPGYGIKTYLYSEDGNVAPSGNPNLLTGILDEKGTRFESYAYDASDRGIFTSLAGGVETYRLTYTSGYNFVTDPRGFNRYYYLIKASGSSVVETLRMQNEGSTVLEHSYTYDTGGNIASDTYFGTRTNFTYDLTRNLEISRTEAVGKAQQRTITTQWDPNLPVPLLITESGRTTAFTYDANGNVLTQTITDTATNASRVWTYTYNSVGQKLTETNPAGETTTYTYDTSGNILTVTNAIGQVTTYSDYTALGQAGKIVYANGHQITYIYDDAGRVTKSTETTYSAPYQATDTTQSTLWPQWVIDLINAFCQLIGTASPFDASGSTAETVYVPLVATPSRLNITQYSYDPIGQLKTVTMHSGETLTYGYDDAHRLVSATDSLGNSITYTLNDAGDITNTETVDPTGYIKLQTEQVYDILGRVIQNVDSNDQTTMYTYDNYNNLTKTTDPLARITSSTYDPFNRKATDVNALLGTSTYSYNALDQLLTVKDARNKTTSYTPNAFGETTEEVSPDTGTTARSYTNGRLNSVLDSNSMTHAFSYDNLGRVTTRTDSGPAATTLTTQFGYDQGTYGKGYLTSVSNATNTMRYSRDSAGNVIENVIAIDAAPLRVQYKYIAGNKLNDIVMPSGRHVTYIYTAGKITSITQNGIRLLSDVKYGPTGVVSWTWGAPTSTDKNTLTYDLDGRLTNVSSTNVLGRDYSYDAGNRIYSIQDATAGIGMQTYTHDKLDRLTQQILADQTLTYAYDANSNRTSKTQTPTAGSAVTSTYTLQTSNNRINTTKKGTSTPLTSTYLPTGQLVSDGIRTYTYDAAGRSTSIIKDGVTVSNAYDGLGQRVRKSVGNVPIYFVYDDNGQLLGEYDQSGNMIREYIWLGNRLVGMSSKDRPNILLSVHTDHLGTVRAVSEGNATTRKVLWRFEGDAFGDVLPNEDVDNNTIKFTMPIRMPGQYYDAEVGISYNYFRDYDPSTGRYVESDPIGLEGGMNTYGYVGGNPTGASDPTGLSPICLAGPYGFGACALTGVATLGLGLLMELLPDPTEKSAFNGCPPKPGNEDPCKGYRKVVKEHEEKLREYLNNPFPADNRKLLSYALSKDDMDLFWKIRAERIKSLLAQIEHHKKALKACEDRYGKKS